ncbi:hypothetical protein SNE40_014826 [Patella caerulea]|uniref:Uncharacterized protein n=1 Tax=Patella caerulea TaxID=87958 RepID=A0AAN8PU37_PATCE
MAFMMMLPPLCFGLCIYCWCCFLQNHNPPLSNIADDNGHEPEFSENASAPPTVSYMNNPDGISSYSHSSGLHPNSNFSPDSATSYPPTFTNDYHTQFGTPSGNEGGGVSCGGDM